MNIKVTSESADPKNTDPPETTVVKVPKKRQHDYEAWAQDFFGKCGRYVIGKVEVVDDAK